MVRKSPLFIAAALLFAPLTAYSQSPPVSILDLRVNLEDEEGQAEVGMPLSLQLNLRANERASVVYIFQVKDPDGYTAHVSWQATELAAGEEGAFASSWVPTREGRHTVEAFVWQNSLSPVALSDASRVDLDVEQIFSVTYCVGTAECFTGAVTKVVDGDTLDVGTTRIRLALVNTPGGANPDIRKRPALPNRSVPWARPCW